MVASAAAQPQQHNRDCAQMQLFHNRAISVLDAANGPPMKWSIREHGCCAITQAPEGNCFQKQGGRRNSIAPQQSGDAHLMGKRQWEHHGPCRTISSSHGHDHTPGGPELCPTPTARTSTTSNCVQSKPSAQHPNHGQHMASGSRKPAGVRGMSWQKKETLDLLKLLGDRKVQQMLKNSRRNLDCFKDIAEEMAAKGHRCSAIGCHAKAKAMCLQHKKLVVHNNQSGAGHVECH